MIDLVAPVPTQNEPTTPTGLIGNLLITARVGDHPLIKMLGRIAVILVPGANEKFGVCFIRSEIMKARLAITFYSTELRVRVGVTISELRVALGRRPAETVEEAPPPTRSIPEQIEELLQARLESLPDFQGRAIHVIPSVTGGVRIEVDGVFYEGVSEVEDDTVRALLQDVVREWEENQ